MITEIVNSPCSMSEEANIPPPYQIESAAYRHAKMELDVLFKIFNTKENPPLIKDFVHEILALVNKFGHSGQSGGSAPYVANSIAEAVRKLCLFKTLAPITGDDDEWGLVGDRYSRDIDSNMMYQNKRLSSIFKGRNGKVWYLDAITWRTQNGNTWSGSASIKGQRINSHQYIKSFPFDPKKFIVDVIETEVNPGDFMFEVKDEQQLVEVFNYYDLMQV